MADFDSTYKNKAKFLILESNYTFTNDWVATFSYSYQDAAIDRYFDQDPDVTIQLTNSIGTCWTSAFTRDHLKRNHGDQFNAVAK